MASMNPLFPLNSPAPFICCLFLIVLVLPTLSAANLEHYQVVIKANCTLQDHFRNINVFQSETYFNNITALAGPPLRYLGAFPPLQLRKIRSDLACVENLRESDTEEMLYQSFGHDTNGSHESLSQTPLEEVTQRVQGLHSNSKRKDLYSPYERSRDPEKYAASDFEWQSYSQFSSVHWNLKAIVNEKKVTGWDSWRYLFYYYVQGAGTNVDIYVFSAGIRRDIKEFGDRVTLMDEFMYVKNEDIFIEERYWGKDPTGEGTAVAGLASGASSGVSKFAKIYDVPFSSPYNKAKKSDRLVLGLQSMLRQHQIRKLQSQSRGSVAIICSQELTTTNAVQDAIQQASDAGIFIVAPAGDYGDTGRNVSMIPVYPCVLSGVMMCVGAIDKDYQRESGSNYGPPVTLWAPGGPIFTAYSGSRDRKETGPSRWGSTYAAAQVAGAAAIFLQKEDLKNDPGKVALRFRNNAAQKLIENFGKDKEKNDTKKGLKDNWNLLLNTGVQSKESRTHPFNDKDADMFSNCAPQGVVEAFRDTQGKIKNKGKQRAEDQYGDTRNGEGSGTRIRDDTNFGDFIENPFLPPDLDHSQEPPGAFTFAGPSNAYDSTNDQLPDGEGLELPPPPYTLEDNPNQPGGSQSSDSAPSTNTRPPESGTSAQPGDNDEPAVDPENDSEDDLYSSGPQIQDTAPGLPVFSGFELSEEAWCDFEREINEGSSRVRKRRLTRRDEPHKYYPACIQQDSALQVSVEGARFVWMDLEVLSGHTCSYPGDGEPQPVLPCDGDVCAYFVTNIAEPQTNGSRVNIDCAQVAEAVKAVICTCPGPGQFRVGGSVMMPQVPNLGVVLGNKGQTFDNSTMRKLRLR